MRIATVLLSLCVIQLVCLAIPYAVYCQTESFDAMQYTPPKGWTRSTKEGMVIYTDVDKAAGRFCILTIYAASPSSGSPSKDFSNKWNDLIVTPFKAAANPETETKTEDGWIAVVGVTQVESDGTKAVVIMTVYSGFGKAVATYAMFNDQSYLPQLEVFNSSIKVDKTIAGIPKPAAPSSEYLDFDPFPDLPNHDPQKPLVGPLKKTITVADLAGTWQAGAGSVTSYYNSSSGNYVGTNTAFYGELFNIKPNGTFDFKFNGRSGGVTVRETDAGTVSLSGQFITFNYRVRSTEKYQFVAYMVLPNGGAVLTLIPIGVNEPGLSADRIRINCGHSDGFVGCQGDTIFTRVPGGK